jgi:hypothetical protein
MGWEARGGRKYFYRTVRVPGGFARVYYGRGAQAMLASLEQGYQRALRQAAARARRRADERQAAAARAARPLDELAALLVRATLVAAGYHQHRRHWRKNRHARDDHGPGPDVGPERRGGPDGGAA